MMKKALILALVVCMVLPMCVSAAIADIIVDDSDSGFVTTGSFETVQDGTCINGSYKKCTESGGEATATWNFTVPMAANYEVYIRYPYTTSAPNVPVEIGLSCGAVIGNSLRQTQNANYWHYLGRYYFDPNDNSYVRLSNDYSKSFAADAVKIVYARRQADPVDKSNKQARERMLSLSLLMQPDYNEMYINGKKTISDVAPTVVSDRTYLPLRMIGEGLGGTVSYDDATETATVVKDGKTVSLTLGKAEISVNGEVKAIDAAPFLKNDRTMVPVRAIAEGFDMSVLYDDGLIFITDEPIDTEQSKNTIEDMRLKFGFESAVPENTILVEAESFSSLGGWVLDQQSMDLMGSPYIMAHGLGTPVKNAATAFNASKAGQYRMWVRTKNWTELFGTNGAPGQFKVLLNGSETKETFGTHGADWFWQDGGVVTLKSGSNSLELKDLTGFNGRCDAILFTTDTSFTPIDSGYALDLFRDAVKKPQITDKGNYDLVVVGAGVAGACLAVGAARNGVKVALIQDRPVIGGNSSSEVGVGVSGEGNFLPYPEIGNLVNEYKKSNKQKFVSNEKNITLFMNYHADEVDVRADKSIEAVYATDTVNGGRIKVGGTLFADCTGDGTLGYMAGADYEIQSEGMMGATNIWRTKDMGEEVSFPNIDWGFDLTGINFPGRKAKTDAETVGSLGGWYWEAGMDLDNAIDGEQVRDNNLLGMFSAWNALKNVDHRMKNYSLQSATYITGKRESRRLMGDVILHTPDIYNETDFVDGLVPCTWTVDLHYADPIHDMDKLPDHPFITYCIQVPYTSPFWLPYRTLYSRNIPNLFMAGRDISVTHDALGATRVQMTTGMMGEILGMASAICKKYNCLPRDVYESHVDELIEMAKQGY